MAKKKGRPRKPTGEGTPVRIDADIASKAKLAAHDRGIALSAYLSELLRPAVDRDFGKIVKRLADAEGEGGEGGGR